MARGGFNQWGKGPLPHVPQSHFSALHSQRNQDHFQHIAKSRSLSQGSTMTSSRFSNKIQTPQAAVILQASFIAGTPPVCSHITCIISFNP